MARWRLLEVRWLGGCEFEELWEWRGWWRFPQPFAPTAPEPHCHRRWVQIVWRCAYVVRVARFALGGG